MHGNWGKAKTVVRSYVIAKKSAGLRLIEGNPGRRPVKPEVKAKGKPRPPKSFDEAHVELWNELLEAFPDEF